MGIAHLYDSTATTQREGYVGMSTVKKAMANHLTSFACHIQPFEASIASDLPGSFGKRWIMFCATADFKEGDKVVVNGTDEYRIMGVETFNMSGNPHAEVTLKAFKE